MSPDRISWAQASDHPPRKLRGGIPGGPRGRPDLATLLATLLALAAAGCVRGDGLRAPSAVPAPGAVRAFPREEPFVVRPFRPYVGPRWIGAGVAYGPHRDGQRPGGASPSKAQLREDLDLLAPHWGLLRVYNAVGPAESLLAVIREDRRDMKVMLGVWVAPEERRDSTGAVVERFPANREENRREIETAIRLAQAYPDIVLAVCVGNETQIFWSAHRVPPDLLVAGIREIRARTTLPVTTADDFNFWNKPASRDVAREVDFVVTQMHPLWNGLALADALEWTKQTFASVVAVHPDRTVVLGETGWATRKHAVGEQATLIKGQPGEAEQATFHAGFRAWSENERVTTFEFEAFDENWKGGEHPDEVEKHWGLFRADRTPKPAMAGAAAR